MEAVEHSAGKTWGRVLPGWLSLIAALAAQPAAAAEVVFRDDFTQAAPSEGWQFLDENPATRSFTARPGFLRILTERGALAEDNRVSNLYVREMSGDFILETRLEFDPNAAQHFAGLLIYESPANASALGLTFVSGERREFRGLALVSSAGGSSDSRPPLQRYDADTAGDPTQVWLRLLRSGDQLVAGFSEDGIAFTDFGSIEVSFPDTVFVGMGATNGDFDGCGLDCDTPIPADFDFFQIISLEEDPGNGEPAALVSVEVQGPTRIIAGNQAEFRALAIFTDGSEVDVTDEAEWFAGPADVARIEGNRIEALPVAATRPATVVALYEHSPPGNEPALETGTLVVLVSPSAGGVRLCGAGAGMAFIGLFFSLGTWRAGRRCA